MDIMIRRTSWSHEHRSPGRNEQPKLGAHSYSGGLFRRAMITRSSIPNRYPDALVRACPPPALAAIWRSSIISPDTSSAPRLGVLRQPPRRHKRKSERSNQLSPVRARSAMISPTTLAACRSLSGISCSRVCDRAARRDFQPRAIFRHPSRRSNRHRFSVRLPASSVAGIATQATSTSGGKPQVAGCLTPPRIPTPLPLARPRDRSTQRAGVHLLSHDG